MAAGDLAISQVSSVDLCFKLDYMDNGLVWNFIACWNLFYMWGLLGLRIKTLEDLTVMPINLLIWCGNNPRTSGDLVAGQVNRRSVQSHIGQGHGQSSQSQILSQVKNRSCQVHFRTFKFLSTVRTATSNRHSSNYSYYSIPVYGLLRTDSNASRQIRLDFYLFSPEWKGLSSLSLKMYVMPCMITLVGEFVLWSYYPGCTFSICFHTKDKPFWHLECGRCNFLVTSCKENIITDRNVEDYCSLDMMQRDGCSHYDVYEAFYKSVGIGIVAFRQIKLDLHMFSPVWIGLA